MPRSRSFRLGPWIAIALVAVSWVLQRPALAEVGAFAPPPGVELHRPLAYVVLSPLTATLDGLSLLTLSQHVVVLLTLVLWFVARRFSGRQRGSLPTAGIEGRGRSHVALSDGAGHRLRHHDLHPTAYGDPQGLGPECPGGRFPLPYPFLSRRLRSVRRGLESATSPKDGIPRRVPH